MWCENHFHFVVIFFCFLKKTKIKTKQQIRIIPIFLVILMNFGQKSTQKMTGQNLLKRKATFSFCTKTLKTKNIFCSFVSSIYRYKNGYKFILFFVVLPFFILILFVPFIRCLRHRNSSLRFFFYYFNVD